jgi:CheY-like chemotaxis protein
MYLERHGYRVLTAASGAEGLRALQDHPVNIVILDYHMPGMDGETVAREVRRVYPTLPIVLLSGHQADDGWPVLHLFDGYVSKLDLPTRLPAMVQNLLHASAPPTARPGGD